MPSPTCELCGGAHPTEIHAEQMESEGAEWPKVWSREKRESRVEDLREAVQELFPGDEAREIRENIERSFLVPQVGDYHNEGMMMDSHLDLIRANIEAIARGEFPEEIPVSIRDAMSRAVARDRKAVDQYVFLHDISKADCLTVKFEGEERAVTWEQWTGMLSATSDGQAALGGDEAALKRFCEAQGITGIAYWQKGEDGNRKHGEIGAEEVRAAGVVDDETMLAAIEAHEVAYQFEKINMPTYEKYFSDMTDDQRDFALTASFVDTMSSLRPDGKPDLTNFLALARSKEKAEQFPILLEALGADSRAAEEVLTAFRAKDQNANKLMNELVKGLSAGKYDAGVIEKAVMALRKNDQPLAAENLEKVASRMKEAAKLPSYNADKLREGAQVLVDEGVLTAEDLDELVGIAMSDPAGIGRTFGKKLGKHMGRLRGMLEASRE